VVAVMVGDEDRSERRGRGFRIDELTADTVAAVDHVGHAVTLYQRRRGRAAGAAVPDRLRVPSRTTRVRAGAGWRGAPRRRPAERRRAPVRADGGAR